MDENRYRIAPFSQDTRLNAAYERRSDLIMQAKANPTNDALYSQAQTAGKQYLAVHQVGGVCEALVMKWLKLKLKDSNARMASVDRDKTFEKASERRGHH